MFNIKMLTQKNTKLWLVSQHSLLESRRCFIVQCNHTTSSNSLVFVVFEPPPCHKAFTTHSFQCAGVFFMFSLHLKERTANQKMLNNHHLVLSQKFSYTFHCELHYLSITQTTSNLYSKDSMVFLHDLFKILPNTKILTANEEMSNNHHSDVVVFISRYGTSYNMFSSFRDAVNRRGDLVS